MPGASDWLTTQFAMQRQIEGYASQVSAAAGDVIRLFVSTEAPAYDISVYRIGWYGGVGASLKMHQGPFPGMLKPDPLADADSGLVECQWTSEASFTVPDDWVSGIYLIRFEASDGFMNYYPLVVREKAPQSDLLFQASTTTYQAYNLWGGESFYRSLSGVGHRSRANTISFDRPYTNGTGDFLAWEYPTLKWLERQGYNVSYVSDMDLQAHPELPLSHKVFLSVGHDEYWSKEMRDSIEGARDHGVNLMFLSSDVSHWQIRAEPSPLGDHRHLICYKDHTDPYLAIDKHLATLAWRDKDGADRPENSLIGVMSFTGMLNPSDDMYVPVHFLNSNYLDVDLASPTLSLSPRVIGYEYDMYVEEGAPRGVKVLAASPTNHFFSIMPAMSNSTLYTAPSGAQVFAAGSLAWGFGMEFWWNTPQNSAVQNLTTNLLNGMLNSLPNGDADGDGVFTFRDITLALQATVEPPSPALIRRIDVAPIDLRQGIMGDGQIDVRDVTHLLRSYLGLEPLKPTSTDELPEVEPQATYGKPGSALALSALEDGSVIAGSDLDWQIVEQQSGLSIDAQGNVQILSSAEDGKVAHVIARRRNDPSSTSESTITIQNPRRWKVSFYSGSPPDDLLSKLNLNSYHLPAQMATDSDGNLYFADSLNETIRKIDAGGITTSLFPSVFGHNPVGMIVLPTGKILFTDTTKHSLQLLDAGAITPFGGTGQKGFADGPLSDATFNYPSGLAYDDAGNVYVADTGNHAIRRVSPDGQVTTIAGNGKPGLTDGVAGTSQLYYPYGLAWSKDGLWIADTGNHAIRLWKPDGTLVTVAGNGTPGHSDGMGAQASFTLPTSILVRSDQTLWIADYGNNTVRSLDEQTGAVTTVLGDGNAGQEEGGDRVSEFLHPFGLTASPNGTVYLSDRSRIYKIEPFSASP